jgi:D-amino peptidase
MKIFVSVDMEGATGIVHREQLVPGGEDYERARKLLMGDVNAAIEGAVAGGATELLVNDAHGTMRNLLIEDLHEAAELISGPWTNKPLCQSEGIDESYGLGFFVGYHSRSNTAGGLLSHTWVGKVIHGILINGAVSGETAINAGVLGAHGVGVGLVTGGDDLVTEAAEIVPGALAVSVKTPLGLTGARCRPPARTTRDIREAAREAVTRAKRDGDEAFPPVVYPEPVDFRIQLHTWQMTERAAKWEKVERTDEREVRVLEDSFVEAAKRAWQTIEFLLAEEPALRLR